MQVENHKEEVPFSHYTQLFAKLDPQEVVARLPFVTWDGERFGLTLLGRRYRIAWPEYALESLDGPEPKLPTQTFLSRCLLETKNIAWNGEWKTFREMPWGELYIQPYTGRVLTRAAYTLGTKIGKFRAAAENMGAVPVKHGDAGYLFEFFGPYRMQILAWEPDEEFPPNAQVLYTDNFAEGFAAEDRVVAGDILITAIKENM